MLHTLSLANLFPGNSHHIQAILTARKGVEVYRLAGDVYYVIKKL
jgi:hypothetical protein